MSDNTTQTKIFIFLERLWLSAAAIGVLCVVYFLLTKDNDSAVFFFGFFILSALLYLMRKRQRVRHQTQLKKTKNRKKFNQQLICKITFQPIGGRETISISVF